jgi:integrase
MSVKKRGTKWWIDVTVWKGGEKVRIRRPAGPAVKSKPQALAEEAAERTRLEGMTANELKPPFFSNFADDFLATHAKANNKPSEYASKQMMLACHLKPAFGHLRLNEIGVEQIEQYKASKLAGDPAAKIEPLAPKSINNHLICLATILAVAVEWRRIDRAPKIRKLKVPTPETNFLTFAQAEALVSVGCPAVGMPWSAMIMAGLRAGLRISEMIALRWKDVDFAAGRIAVVENDWCGIPGTPKGGTAGYVPLSQELAAILREVPSRTTRHALVFCEPDGTKFTREQCHRPIRKACRKAGLRPAGWHALRHTFASHLVMRGVPIKVVQELMRHATIISTMRYAHLAPQTKVDAVELLTTKRDETGGHGM